MSLAVKIKFHRRGIKTYRIATHLPPLVCKEMAQAVQGMPCVLPGRQNGSAGDAAPRDTAPKKQISGKAAGNASFHVTALPPGHTCVPFPLPEASCPGKACIYHETGSGGRSSARWPSSYAELHFLLLHAPKSA